MGGGGAVAGNAVAGLALSSTSMLVGGRAQTVEADAVNLADRIGAELGAFFVKQGWIAEKRLGAALPLRGRLRERVGYWTGPLFLSVSS